MTDLLTTKEAAGNYRVSVSTFLRLAKQDGFPEPILFGKRKMHWRASDIATWLDAR